MTISMTYLRSRAEPMQEAATDVEGTFVEIGRVGHEDQNPAYMWIEGQQAWCEVTRRNGEEAVARVGEEVRDLKYGDAVVLAYFDGDPQQAVIVSRLNDNAAPMPAAVAGVSTGAAPTSKTGVTAPAPTFYFVRTREGRLLALETGSGGDVLIHSGAGVHVKATTTHLEGTVHLGDGPSVAPTGSKVAPGNGETPGTPMVPRVPVPHANPTLPPYAGDRDAVVRASDEYQSNAAVDPAFWAKFAGMFVMFEAWTNVLPVLLPAYEVLLAIPPAPIPTKIDSKAKSASTKVTAAP